MRLGKRAKHRSIHFYYDKNKKSPFIEWLESLDIKTRARVKHRLTRIEAGNLGDYASVRDGILEFRFTFGPGYRIYFGEVGDRCLMLLVGGGKGSQKKDIKKAREYWEEYKERRR